jgi:hypothetical protein
MVPGTNMHVNSSPRHTQSKTVSSKGNFRQDLRVIENRPKQVNTRQSIRKVVEKCPKQVNTRPDIRR